MNQEVIDSIGTLRHKLAKENNWTEEEWSQAELEYVRFLTIHQANPKSPLAPSELMDKMWHGHILNTQAYARDCEALFGRFLHHVPHLEAGVSEENQEAYESTQELYEKMFDCPMIMSASARCEGKPCHVESECRCR